TGAILFGDQKRHLEFSPAEHPISLQLGGDDPAALAECAQIAEAWGYDEVNINVGCPSDRVQNGNFGACLMARPETVAAGVTAMRKAVAIPVTVKHRIGIDEHDSYAFMRDFVAAVVDAGADRVSVHARIAWLQGLSPKQNREIPPLRYEDIYRLKQEFSDTPVELNGGVKDLESVAEHLDHVDAVMLGRAAWDTPYLFRRGRPALFRLHQNAAQPPRCRTTDGRIRGGPPGRGRDSGTPRVETHAHSLRGTARCQAMASNSDRRGSPRRRTRSV
ncbi:MAG: tRNA dihydrouridine(20/20a) synthase DusA, partial [Myxococcota bacterium]